MNAVLVGPDEDDLADALREFDVDVTTIAGQATRPDIEEAGVVEADLLLVTDVEQATIIPIATDLVPEIRAVVYDRSSLPEFVSGQTDLAVDPELIEPGALAEALVEVDDADDEAL